MAALEPDNDVRQYVEQHGGQMSTVCVLCGSPDVSVSGLFLPGPEFAKRLHVPDHKQRVCVFALCQHCLELGNKESRLEDVFLTQAVGSCQ